MNDRFLITELDIKDLPPQDETQVTLPKPLFEVVLLLVQNYPKSSRKVLHTLVRPLRYEDLQNMDVSDII